MKCACAWTLRCLSVSPRDFFFFGCFAFAQRAFAASCVAGWKNFSCSFLAMYRLALESVLAGFAVAAGCDI